MIRVFLLEYTTCSRPCWIAAQMSHHAFGVTYNQNLARRFESRERADQERQELRLGAEWAVVERSISRKT